MRLLRTSTTHKWRILKNESAAIGLFQGMFDENILTFNPEDLRPIQKVTQGRRPGICLRSGFGHDRSVQRGTDRPGRQHHPTGPALLTDVRYCAVMPPSITSSLPVM